MLCAVSIQNYNKSRIHSSRGARHMRMFLDGHMIFSGEIAKANGTPANDTAEVRTYMCMCVLQIMPAYTLERGGEEMRGGGVARTLLYVHS